ncbi:MAG: PDZ domain-containing protein, partial [Planctomycetes bacterium]|nr:PDZ domain-containing protein [Planctomycetota bacterium]
RVAQGFASFVRRYWSWDNGSVVGYDRRFGSDRFAQAVAEVLAGNSILANLVDRPCPTPVAAFSIATVGAAGAVMITASHNPPSDNGFKVRTSSGAAVAPDNLAKIEAEVARVAGDDVRSLDLQTATEAGLIKIFNPDAPYLDHVANLLDLPALRDRPVRVVVEAPDGWKISSGLDSSPGEPYTLVAPTYDVLIDAPLEIGTHEIHTFEVDGLPFELAIWGRGNYVAETLVADLQKLCSEQIRMWGDAPFSRYVFLLHVTSGAGGGTEHLNSTIMQTSRDSFAPRKKYRRFLGLVAHEFFHTWNVKALRPAGLMPYDYTKENYTPLLWVAEGTTSYYGPLTLVRAGLRKPREYLRELSKSIQSFRERPGRHVQSLDMSSFDAWTKFNKSNAHSPNTTVSFYRKGALVSLLLDLEIRQRTADAASLDDVLRTLYQRFALQGRGYSRADLLATINAVSGSDFSEFFRRFVGGTDELPLEAALDHAGLRIHSKPAKHDRDDEDEDEDEDEDDDNGEDDDERLSDEKGEVPVKAYVGIALRDSDGLARVSRVMTDGPAYRGGVQADDLIVALDARRLRADDLERRLESYEPGDTIELTLLRRDILKRIRLILVARDDVSLKIETVTDPTAAQIAMYESWLGQPWPKKSRKPTTQPTSDHTP